MYLFTNARKKIYFYVVYTLYKCAKLGMFLWAILYILLFYF